MTQDNNKEEFPSIDQQLDNLSKFVFEMVTDVVVKQDLNVFVSDDVKEERLKICRTCDYFAARQRRCKHCGCWLEHKAKFIASTCPIDKW
jgi:hypothetical protein